MKLHWTPESTPREAHGLLAGLAEEFPIEPGGEVGEALRFDFDEGIRGVRVGRDASGYAIRFGSLSSLGRGLGTVLAGGLKPGDSLCEEVPFGTFGVMLDVSRNAVMRPDYVRRWLRRLCLLGYNRLMLYTEDTYVLPGEPYFGCLRGGYSADDLRQIDRWAAALGIEVCACIQGLGHLEQMLKWPAYDAVRDTPGVLLADEEATVSLIEKMIATMAGSLRSRTIHIGFDEAHDLGRGKHLDRHGYQPPFEIFARHLQKVAGICKDHGLRPLIWSDMLFRLGSRTGDYYDRASAVPPDAIKALPTEVQMVYWDYYGMSEDHYRYWIGRHEELGGPVTVAASAWTWMAPWYNRAFTEATVRPCMDACRAAGVRDFLLTLWGDDGAYCELDSAWAGIAFAADLAWRGAGAGDLEARFEALCGLPYAHAVLPCEMEPSRPGAGIPLDQNGYLIDGIGPVLWDDPLYGIVRRNRGWDGGYWAAFAERQGQVLEGLLKVPPDTGLIDLAHARNLARLLLLKVTLANAMEQSYRSGNLKGLLSAAARIPEAIEAIENFQASFRCQWLRRNRPHGLETVQIRCAGLAERYRELARRVSEYAAGGAATIPEWDEPAAPPGRGPALWRQIASPGIL